MRGEAIARTLRALKARWWSFFWSFFYRRCVVGFPWFQPARPPGMPVMVTARRMARRHFGRDHHPAYRALAQVLSGLLWPPAVLLQLWEIRYSRGSEAIPIKQIPGALWAAMRHNVQPGEYYAYALWRPDRKVNIDNYMYDNEGPRLFKLLNRPSQPNPIDDKLSFYEMCQLHALPTPEVLAAFTPAGPLFEFKSGMPPEHDLFVKPRAGVGSNGTEHLRWHGSVFESNWSGRLRREELGSYLATRARTENQTLLIQPALVNHPQLLAGPNACLAPARLVTGLSNDGEVIPIYSHIHFFYAAGKKRIPRTPRVALIDVASGRLRSPPQEIYGTKRSNYLSNDNSDDYRTLPDWCRMLPDWDIVLQTTKVAHQVCSNYVFIGWDVALTDRGPILLEGNLNWTAADYQRLSGEPLGRTKFADILAGRLSQLP